MPESSRGAASGFGSHSSSSGPLSLPPLPAVINIPLPQVVSDRRRHFADVFKSLTSATSIVPAGRHLFVLGPQYFSSFAPSSPPPLPQPLPTTTTQAAVLKEGTAADGGSPTKREVFSSTPPPSHPLLPLHPTISITANTTTTTTTSGQHQNGDAEVRYHHDHHQHYLPHRLVPYALRLCGLIVVEARVLAAVKERFRGRRVWEEDFVLMAEEVWAESGIAQQREQEQEPQGTAEAESGGVRGAAAPQDAATDTRSRGSSLLIQQYYGGLTTTPPPQQQQGSSPRSRRPSLGSGGSGGGGDGGGSGTAQHSHQQPPLTLPPRRRGSSAFERDPSVDINADREFLSPPTTTTSNMNLVGGGSGSGPLRGEESGASTPSISTNASFAFSLSQQENLVLNQVMGPHAVRRLSIDAAASFANNSSSRSTTPQPLIPQHASTADGGGAGGGGGGPLGVAGGNVMDAAATAPLNGCSSSSPSHSTTSSSTFPLQHYKYLSNAAYALIDELFAAFDGESDFNQQQQGEGEQHSAAVRIEPSPSMTNPLKTNAIAQVLPKHRISPKLPIAVFASILCRYPNEEGLMGRWHRDKAFSEEDYVRLMRALDRQRQRHEARARVGGTSSTSRMATSRGTSALRRSGGGGGGKSPPVYKNSNPYASHISSRDGNVSSRSGRGHVVVDGGGGGGDYDALRFIDGLPEHMLHHHLPQHQISAALVIADTHRTGWVDYRRFSYVLASLIMMGETSFVEFSALVQRVEQIVGVEEGKERRRIEEEEQASRARLVRFHAFIMKKIWADKTARADMVIREDKERGLIKTQEAANRQRLLTQLFHGLLGCVEDAESLSRRRLQEVLLERKQMRMDRLIVQKDEIIGRVGIQEEEKGLKYRGLGNASNDPIARLGFSLWADLLLLQHHEEMSRRHIENTALQRFHVLHTECFNIGQAMANVREQQELSWDEADGRDEIEAKESLWRVQLLSAFFDEVLDLCENEETVARKVIEAEADHFFNVTVNSGEQFLLAFEKFSLIEQDARYDIEDEADEALNKILARFAAFKHTEDVLVPLFDEAARRAMERCQEDEEDGRYAIEDEADDQLNRILMQMASLKIVEEHKEIVQPSAEDLAAERRRIEEEEAAIEAMEAERRWLLAEQRAAEEEARRNAVDIFNMKLAVLQEDEHEDRLDLEEDEEEKLTFIFARFAAVNTVEECEELVHTAAEVRTIMALFNDEDDGRCWIEDGESAERVLMLKRHKLRFGQGMMGIGGGSGAASRTASSSAPLVNPNPNNHYGIARSHSGKGVDSSQFGPFVADTSVATSTSTTLIGGHTVGHGHGADLSAASLSTLSAASAERAVVTGRGGGATAVGIGGLLSSSSTVDISLSGTNNSAAPPRQSHHTLTMPISGPSSNTSSSNPFARTSGVFAFKLKGILEDEEEERMDIEDACDALLDKLLFQMASVTVAERRFEAPLGHHAAAKGRGRGGDDDDDDSSSSSFSSTLIFGDQSSFANASLSHFLSSNGGGRRGGEGSTHAAAASTMIEVVSGGGGGGGIVKVHSILKGSRTSSAVNSRPTTPRREVGRGGGGGVGGSEKNAPTISNVSFGGDDTTATNNDSVSSRPSSPRRVRILDGSGGSNGGGGEDGFPIVQCESTFSSSYNYYSNYLFFSDFFEREAGARAAIEEAESDALDKLLIKFSFYVKSETTLFEVIERQTLQRFLDRELDDRYKIEDMEEEAFKKLQLRFMILRTAVEETEVPVDLICDIIGCTRADLVKQNMTKIVPATREYIDSKTELLLPPRRQPESAEHLSRRLGIPLPDFVGRNRGVVRSAREIVMPSQRVYVMVSLMGQLQLTPNTSPARGVGRGGGGGGVGVGVNSCLANSHTPHHDGTGRSSSLPSSVSAVSAASLTPLIGGVTTTSSHGRHALTAGGISANQNNASLPSSYSDSPITFAAAAALSSPSPSSTLTSSRR